MVDRILSDLRVTDVSSVLDIGAGDGRVLAWFGEACQNAKQYAIEKSSILLQRQPDHIIPVGTEFAEQDLMGLPVDVVFCNPPYREFEEWAARIIATAHASQLYLVIPRRWRESAMIQGALKSRGVEAKIIHSDHFEDAERRARAVVDIIRLRFFEENRWGRTERQDPFDRWFDQHIDTFEKEAEIKEAATGDTMLARLRGLDSIAELVESFNEDYARMQEHYTAIFRLDAGLLKELGVNKHGVRDGLKQKMLGLKNVYWSSLFEHLDVVTSRLTTATKKRFLDRLTGQTAVAFTVSNAYAVVLWAIKAANAYFDGQVVSLFRELGTREGVSSYASNRRTWDEDAWRYNRYAEKYVDLGGRERPSHYALDYRIVLPHHVAIYNTEFGQYDYPGDLHKSCHELIDDVIAVLGNLGFVVRPLRHQRQDKDTGAWWPDQELVSRARAWQSNCWQDFTDVAGDVLFQVKAFKNGNLHFRFKPEAIRAINIEAGRLLGWIRKPADVVTELGYTADDAERYFGSNQRLGRAAVKLLGPTPSVESSHAC